MSDLFYSANPSVGPLNKDGSKLVTVRDPKNECYKTLKVSAEKADEYIKTRKEKMNKVSFIANSWTVGLLAGFSAIGAAVGRYVKSVGRGEGFALGLGIAMLTCCLPWVKYNPASEDKKVTEQFIKENSEKEVVAE